MPIPAALFLATCLTLASTPPQAGFRQVMAEVDSLLEEGRGQTALAVYLDVASRAGTSPRYGHVATRFAARGLLEEAWKILEHARDRDVQPSGGGRALRTTDAWEGLRVRGDLHAVAGEYEEAFAAYDASGERLAGVHRDWLRAHCGLPSIRSALGEDCAPPERLELTLVRGDVLQALADLDSPGAFPPSGGCALAPTYDRGQRATQRASVLLAAGRVAQARAADPSWLDSAWFDLVAVPRDPSAEFALIQRLLQLDPDGLPLLYPNEGSALARVANADAFAAWETFVGRLGRAPGWPPSSGLRLAALARLLDVEGSTELAMNQLGGPEELCALTLLALQCAEGVLDVLASRARGTLLDVDPAHRETLVRILTLHGTPEAYAAIRDLAAEAAPDVAREIRATLWRHPPWARTTWRAGFLPEVR